MQPANERPEEAVADTVRQIESSWRGLLDALAGIPPDRMTEAGASGE